MIRKIRLSLLSIFILTSFLPTYADEQLEQVLEEIKALRAQIVKLEARIDTLEGEQSEVAPATTPVLTATPPVQQKEKRRWFESMRVELKKAETLASGGWVEPEAWTKVAAGMREEEALAILGEPTDRKFSVRKDTDEILIYEGDLTGTGELVSGEVRIYKGKVRRLAIPDFPEE